MKWKLWKMMPRTATACCLAALFAFSSDSFAATFVVNTIALTGVDDARGPGLGSGVTYNNFQSVRFGPGGSFAYRSELAGGGTPFGVFSGNSGGAAPVVLSNSTAPNVPGATFSVVTPAGFLADGTLLYTGELEGAGVDSSNNEAAFVTGGTGPLFREGQPAPGLPLTTITSFSSQVSGNRPTFRAEIQGLGVNSTNDVVLYSGSSLAQVAREGSAANSDLNPNEYIGLMGARDSRDNNVHFQAPILESAGNTLVASGIFSWDGISATTIARTDQDAVGTTGAQYGSLDLRDVSPDGDEVYYSVLTGPSVTSSNDRALFRTSGSSISLLAREGDPVPDRPGIFLTDVGFPPSSTKLGGDGVAVFLGRWSDNGAKGGWIVERNGVQHLIATRGDALPGLEPGETMNLPSTNDIPIISENGAVAFVNRTSPTGTGPGLWFYGLDNQLRFLLRTGAPFDVDPTSNVDERIVSFIDFQSSARMLNDNSFITKLEFTDGSSGLFTFSLVPEPASAALLGIAALGLLLQRRRR